MPGSDHHERRLLIREQGDAQRRDQRPFLTEGYMRKRLAILATAVAAAVAALFLMPTSSQAVITSTNCDGTFTNTTFAGSIIVPSWGECDLANVKVTGSITVSPNSVLQTCLTAIGGGVTDTQGYVNLDRTTSVGGSINLNAPGFEAIGRPNCESLGGYYEYASVVCPYKVGGGISVQNLPYYAGEVYMGGECGAMNITGGVTIKNNWNLVEFYNSTVHGSLYCANNWPPADVEDVYVYGVTVGCDVYKS
jgi:hypothetical protein